VIDPIAGKAYVVMTNIFGEFAFTRKPLPIIFGDYDWGIKDDTVSKDISGRYNSMRVYFPHGFFKVNNFLSAMSIEKSQLNNVFYLFGSKDRAITQISDNVFLVNDRMGMTFPFFVGDDGVLQSLGADHHKESAASYYANWTLLILCALSCLFAGIVLVAKGIILVSKKIRKREICKAPKEKHHLFSIGCIAAAFLFFCVMYSFSPLYRLDGYDYLTEMAVSGVLTTVSALAAFVFGILQVKTNARRRTRIMRTVTLAASAIVLANDLFWELFNFWSV
jgi:uncharacterized membrane protein HdeD (DUF308 family)